MVVCVLVFAGVFLAFLEYGIWKDIQHINHVEKLAAERKARMYSSDMTPVV